jgi:hypothetical protein
MSQVRKDKRNPRKKEIPDQPEVAARVTVCNSCQNQTNTDSAGCIEQGEHGNVMPVADEEVSESVKHCFLLPQST